MKGFYTYVVRFQVAKTWIEDGFDLTDQRALEMLANDLRFAKAGAELTAKVLKAPTPERIARAQGYYDRPSPTHFAQDVMDIENKRNQERL